MCVNFSLGDLNSGSYPPHLTNTYTYRVTVALRVCGGPCDLLIATSIVGLIPGFKSHCIMLSKT